MSDVDMKDVTGTARSDDELQQALKQIEQEIVRNPMARAVDGVPLMFSYLTIRDCLKELMDFREFRAFVLKKAEK